MGIKTLHHKFKAFSLRKLITGGSERGSSNYGKKPAWMMPVSHGYHVVEDRLLSGELNDFEPVMVQREQNGEHEMWFFGIFDAQIKDGVTKYMQSNLFDKKPKQSQMRRKSEETMKKAYLGARAKIKESSKPEERRKGGSASAIVINGEKLVLANMGGYKVIVCKDGKTHQIGRKHQESTKRHWSHKIFRGAIRMPKVRISGNATGAKHSKSFEPVVSSEKIDPDTEFVILASTGIWEVMKHQEAVNLIRHLDDPQEAAECLAKEALVRMSKSNVSCLIVRFE